MRDKNLSFIQFTDQVGKFFRRKTYAIKILREPVVDSPTLLSDFDLFIPSNKLQELRGLALTSYYVPETLGWKIREVLEEKSRRFNLKDQKRLNLLLYSKDNALAYLYETLEFSSHEIFGNLIQAGLKSLRQLRLSEKKNIVKKPQRKRGYDDKGSLRSFDRWLPSEDYTLTEMHLEIAKTQDLHNRALQFLEHYLCEKVKILKDESEQDM